MMKNSLSSLSGTVSAVLDMVQRRTNMVRARHLDMSRLHIIYAMPGLGKTTALTTIYSLYTVEQLRPYISFYDTDLVRIKDDDEGLTSYFLSVLECGWSPTIVVYTNQWHWAQKMARLGAVIDFACAYSGAGGLDTAVYRHALRDDRDHKEQLKQWISDPDLTLFVESDLCRSKQWVSNTFEANVASAKLLTAGLIHIPHDVSRVTKNNNNK